MSDRIREILTHAESIYCETGDALSVLTGEAQSEAVKFCVSNEVPRKRVASEFGISLKQVREICGDLD